MTTTISQIAKIYADALIKLVQNGKMTFDEVSKDLASVDAILKSSDKLQKVLISPVMPTEQKIAILDGVFKSEISSLILNFLKILAEKKRLDEFGNIKTAFQDKQDEIKGIKRLTVTSAIELDDGYKTKILNKLREKFKKEISAVWKIDKSIIGGLIINIDDNVIDTSIKNKLKNMSKNIIKGNL